MANPPGYIPEEGQGLRAKSVQDGTEGGKYWLKYLKLHKYWPMFSHWSYDEFMSLTEDNIDDMLKQIKAVGLTKGAKGKLLRSISGLHKREEILMSIRSDLYSKNLYINDSLQYLQEVLYTPIPTGPDLEQISEKIIATVKEVYDHLSNHKAYKWVYNKMNNILYSISKRPILHNIMKKKYPMEPLQEFPEIENRGVGPYRRRRSTEDSGFSEDVAVKTQKYKKVNKKSSVNYSSPLQKFKENSNLKNYPFGSGLTHYPSKQTSVVKVNSIIKDRTDKMLNSLKLKEDKPTFSKCETLENNLTSMKCLQSTLQSSFAATKTFEDLQARSYGHFSSKHSKSYSASVSGYERNHSFKEFTQIKEKLPYELLPKHINQKADVINNITAMSALPIENRSEMPFLRHKWDYPTHAIPGVKCAFQTLQHKHWGKKNLSEHHLYKQDNKNSSHLTKYSIVMEKPFHAYHNVPANLFPMYGNRNTQSVNTVIRKEDRKGTNVLNHLSNPNYFNRNHFGLLCGQNSYNNPNYLMISNSMKNYSETNLPTGSSFDAQNARPLSPNSYLLNETSKLVSKVLESVLEN